MRRSGIASPESRVGVVACAAALLGLSLPARAEEEPRGGVSPEVAASTQVETSGFVFKEIPVDEASARSGEGNSVALQGRSITLHGQEIRVGDRLRAPAGQAGRVRIVSVVPALKTPTCEQQTHYLSERSGSLSEQVELVTISLDTPAVQREFSQEAEIDNVTFLSDSEDAGFGRAHGLLIEQPRILTRAVMVVDGDDVVRYLQVVPEVSHMPDMDAAFAFARRLVEGEPAG